LEKLENRGREARKIDKMTLENQPVSVRRELEFPMMLKQMTVQETKEYHQKRLGRLCKESIAKGTFYHDKDYKFSPRFTRQKRKEWKILCEMQRRFSK
jgi:hypothetical protein